MSLITGNKFGYILLALIVGVSAFPMLKPKSENTESGAPIVSVVLPETFSANALAGEKAFEQYCVACHGSNAVGQVGVAPPLVHKIYEPSHHGDASFLRAAKVGVQQHHWPFGNMPPVEGIADDEIVSVIHYIRELQRANGIQ